MVFLEMVVNSILIIIIIIIFTINVINTIIIIIYIISNITTIIILIINFIINNANVSITIIININIFFFIIIITIARSYMLHDINHKVRLAEVIVAREKDFGVNDQQYSCITHLGNILREGDVVFGYDFTNTNWNVDEEDNEDNVLDKHSSFPDLVLVRKVGYKYMLIIVTVSCLLCHYLIQNHHLHHRHHYLFN
jgi:hypothetical protein